MFDGTTSIDGYVGAISYEALTEENRHARVDEPTPCRLNSRATL